LTWTPVGDDGNTGTATAYDLRYSTSPINASNFDSAIPATGEAVARATDLGEGFSVTGLNSSTTYYFALKVADEVPNWSVISNVPNGTTLPAPDTTPPSAVANLAGGIPTATSLTLTWTTVGDDDNTGTATTYDLRYSTSAINASNFATATPATGVPAPHIAGTAESMTVGGLSPSTLYYFALKVADEVPNWSGLSIAPGATTQSASDTVPPAAVTTLAVASATRTATTLAWKATGDDGSTGTATTYDIRYSTSVISQDNFNSATQAVGEPTPTAAGRLESFAITGLNHGTRYYFAMKVADEVPNWSGLSKVVKARTPTPTEVPPPAAITDLWVTDVGIGTARLALRHPETLIEGAVVDHYQARVAETPLDDEVWEASFVVPKPDPGSAGTEVEWLIAGLEPAHTYYLAMRVYDVDGRASELSPDIQFQTEDEDLAPLEPPPGPPQVSWSADGTRLTLRWSASVDPRVAGYALYYAQGQDGDWFRYRPDLLPTPSCEMERPDSSIVRLMAVKSVTAKGVESVRSSSADLYPSSGEPNLQGRSLRSLSIEGPFPHPVIDIYQCWFRISVPEGFPADQVVRVEILSIGGTSEAVLYDGPVPPGGEVNRDPQSDRPSGPRLPPGYHYLLCTGGGSRTLRTIYLAP
jgi:phosphodiesterase/alkaline phosphatase D-like protein